jgi:hypothetical protein
MVGFGPKQAWLAVRDGRPEPVAEALGLRDLGPVPWRSGIDLAYLTDDRLVLTPRLEGADGSGWLLVTGRWLLLRADRPADVTGLSGKLDTEVQFFATYRVGELHRWARAVGGELVRAFGFRGEDGEVTEWRGDPDPAELAIGLPATPPDGQDVLVSEDDVLRLAGAWNIDPRRLADQPAPGPLRAAAAPEPDAYPPQPAL